MFDSEEAFRKLNSYLKLLWQIDCLEGRLNNIINTLNDANNGSYNYYLIDDERIDNKEIESIKDDLIGKKEFLINSCRNTANRHKDDLINEIESNGIEIIWS